MSARSPENSANTDESGVQRSWRFAKLNRRNNIVAVLRWVIPLTGVLVAGYLIFQIILTNIAKDFGLSGLRVEQDRVVVDKPRYGGVTQDGTRYNIEAETAHISTSATDIINLELATITIEQTDGYTMVADAPIAQLDLAEQTVHAPQTMQTRDSDGVKGLFSDANIDWKNQLLTTNGPVRIEFDDGAIINAQSLTYDAAASHWDFSQMTYSIAGDGGL